MRPVLPFLRRGKVRRRAQLHARKGSHLRALKFLRLQFAKIMIGIYRYNGRFFTTRPSRIELAQGGLQEEPSPLSYQNRPGHAARTR
jgi:hypothetical protein